MERKSKTDEMGRIVVGLDADVRRLAFYALAEGRGVVGFGSIDRSHKRHGIYEDYPERLELFVKTLRKYKAALFVEDIFCLSRRGFRSFAQMHGEIAYEIVRQSAQFDVEFHYVLASKWQKALSSHYDEPIAKNETKEFALRMVKTHFDSVSNLEDEHQVDACCIANYGRLVLSGELDA